ncbi:MAG: ferredoxin family protein [Bacillota bacterium]
MFINPSCFKRKGRVQINKKTTDFLKHITIKVAPKSHIKIADSKVCLQQCQEKYCTKFCPTNVFHWSKEEKKIIIDYHNCIECLACPFGCPYQNISWKFPPSSYGVEY